MRPPDPADDGGDAVRPLEQWAAARTFETGSGRLPPQDVGRSAHRRTAAGAGCGVAAAAVLHPDHGVPDPLHRPVAAGGAANRWSYQFNRFTAVAYGGMINTFRRRTLGLPPMSRWTDYLHFPDGRPVPVLYGYSPTVVPAPADYPPHAHVTGYWFTPPRRPGTRRRAAGVPGRR